MTKIDLYPLESSVADVLAQMRGTTVQRLIEELLHKEAALELAGWRSTESKLKPPAPTVARA